MSSCLRGPLHWALRPGLLACPVHRYRPGTVKSLSTTRCMLHNLSTNVDEFPSNKVNHINAKPTSYSSSGAAIGLDSQNQGSQSTEHHDSDPDLQAEKNDHVQPGGLRYESHEPRPPSQRHLGPYLNRRFSPPLRLLPFNEQLFRRFINIKERQQGAESATMEGEELVCEIPIWVVTGLARRFDMDPQLAHYATGAINKAVRWMRPMTLYSLRHDALVRMASLYQQPGTHSRWWAAFGMLIRARLATGKVPNEDMFGELSSETRSLLDLIETDRWELFRRTWETMSRDEMQVHWQPLALRLLAFSPTRILEFVFITSRGKYRVDYSIVTDCLCYAHRFHHLDMRKHYNFSEEDSRYESLVAACLDPEFWPALRTKQKGLRLFLRVADYPTLCRAFDTIMSRDIQIYAETVLGFVYRFTSFQDVDRAMAALRIIPVLNQREFDMNSFGVITHCCKLLTLDTVKEEDGKRNFRILPELLKMGVVPRKEIMNIVLSNAFKTGDPELGLDILNFMKTQGHELDTYTYVTLLCDAVGREDRERAGELIEEIGSKDTMWRLEKHIASKVLHTHYVFIAKRMDELDYVQNSRHIFYSMLEVYNELHDIQPLKDLFIVPANYVQEPRPEPRLPPTTIALYIMIATYFRCQRRLTFIRAIYQRFQELVAKGHPEIALLAETDHTYNEFLVAYRRDPRGLQDSIELVEDMLRPSSPVKIRTDYEEREIECSAPTVRTWTILLTVFTFNKQPQAAEKVMEMMRNRNVEFDQGVWNIIINGYANMQDVPRTAEAISSMEAQGYDMNPYTMNSLRYLRDSERLWIALEELDQRATDQAHMALSKVPVNRSVDARDQLLEQGLLRLKGKQQDEDEDVEQTEEELSFQGLENWQ